MADDDPTPRSARVRSRLLTTSGPIPGNVRELENLIERAFILCERPVIDLRDLPPHVAVTLSRDAEPAAANEAGGSLNRVEIDAIQQALKRHAGNRTHAAQGLGIHRSTLIRKIHRYGL